MKYALAISATKDQFTAAYVSIYSFQKHHPGASVLLFGDKPDVILKRLEVCEVELDTSNVMKLKNPLYTNNLCIGLSDKYDAFIVAKCNILYNRNIEELVNYAIQSRHVIGSTKRINNKLGIDSSFYIVPSNAVNNKIKGTIFSGINKKEEYVLADAYYPILIDIMEDKTFTVNPGVTLIHTANPIVRYVDGAWLNTAQNDLWTEVGEELIKRIHR